MSRRRTVYFLASFSFIALSFLEPAYPLSVDPGFDPNANNDVFTMAVQPDGNILVGGRFTSISDTQRVYLARLSATGVLEAGFNPYVDGWVQTLVVQGDGRILVGGGFSNIAGAAQRYIARLNQDGTLDPTFAPTLNGAVGPIVLQPDGKILIGGSFTTVGSVGRSRIARLNSDGTLDDSFAADVFDNSIYCLALQPDGKIVIGGNFTQIGEISKVRLARLNANGTLDPEFVASANQFVATVAVQTDGKILVGGYFTMIGSTVKPYMARLNPDGSFDASLTYSPSATVTALALQADGKILVGHSYGIYRVNPNGTADNTLFEGTSYAVYTIVIRPDGKVLVGGGFRSMGGQTRNRLALILNTYPAHEDLTVSPDGSTVTWMRTMASPETVRVVFEYSTDGMTWANLGSGTRIVDGWQLAGISLPLGQNYYIRARGFVVSGYFGTAGSLFDSVKMFIGAKGDFDGDGKPDVVWRNISTGRTAIWYMDGATWSGRFADVEPTLSDPNWSIVGIADFNGDNNPDLLWRDASTGRTTIWYMTGPTWNGGSADVEPTLNDPAWSIVGLADFNGDGGIDLLWRNSDTGRTTIWYMTGPTWNGGYADVEPTLNDPNWSIVGLADFNRDGSPDLLWRNSVDGRTTIWYMTGPVWNGGYAELLPTVNDPNWAIVAVRDFNNDGSPDLLWRNTSSEPGDPNAYRTTVWYMDGPVWNGNWGDLLPVVSDPNWIIIGR